VGFINFFWTSDSTNDMVNSWASDAINTSYTLDCCRSGRLGHRHVSRSTIAAVYGPTVTLRCGFLDALRQRRPAISCLDYNKKYKAGENLRNRALTIVLSITILPLQFTLTVLLSDLSADMVASDTYDSSVGVGFDTNRTFYNICRAL